MKANINGINVEGTPQEIAEYQKIMEEKKESIGVKPGYAWVKGTINECPNGDKVCFCTGECMGMFGTKLSL